MKDRFGLRWVVDRLDLRDVLLHMDRFILWSGGLVHYGLGRTVDWRDGITRSLLILSHEIITCLPDPARY